MTYRSRPLGIMLFYLMYPALYILLTNTHRTRVIISSQGKVLFVSGWLSDGKKTLPGGGIKRGETSKKAAVREVYEETGIKLDIADLLLIAKDLRVKEKGVGYRADCYQVSIKETLSTKPSHLEILESNWLKLSEVYNSDQLSMTTNQLLGAWLDKQHLLD
jgi:8-oxo-dGTP pyrophosphatase MutT (NUDIX family)